MFYVLTCLDRKDAGDLRQRTRPAHLAYLEGLGPRLHAAGPLLDEVGLTPVGSLLILACADMAEAEQIRDGDPYAQAGLFAEVQLRPWRKVLPA